MKKNIRYIKFLKSIAILMVCSYHFYWSTEIYLTDKLVMNLSDYNHFSRFIFSLSVICVPIFFMCNGALLLNKKLDIKKHIRSMIKLIKYLVVFNILLLICYLIFNSISIREYGLKNAVNFIFFYGTPKFTASHLWFVKTLLSLYLIFPFVKMAYDEIINPSNIALKNYFLKLTCVFVILLGLNQISRFMVLFFPSLAGLNIIGIQAYLPFNGQLSSMMLYFVLGGYIHNKFYINQEIERIKLSKIILVYVVCSIFLYINWTINGFKGVSPYDVVFDNYGTILGFLTSISFFMLFIKLDKANLLRESKIINVISNNTLEIYFIHWILGITILPIFYQEIFLFFNGDVIYIINILKAAVLVIVIAYGSEIVKRIINTENKRWVQ